MIDALLAIFKPEISKLLFSIKSLLVLQEGQLMQSGSRDSLYKSFSAIPLINLLTNTYRSNRQMLMVTLAGY